MALVIMVKDSVGGEWRVALNTGRLEAIQAATGFNFYSKEMGERMRAGLVSSYDIAWLCCAPEAARLGLNKETFLARFDFADGLKLITASSEVFLDFFPKAAPEKTASAANGDGGPGASSTNLPPAPESNARTGSPYES